MSDTFDRSQLDGKDREQLSEIASALGVKSISRMRKAVVPCPRCGSSATSLLSQFGSTACKAQYRCDDCREPFDYFKPH